MAIVDLHYTIDSEYPTVLAGPAGVSVKVGDEVRFNFWRDFGSASAVLSGLSSTVWTVTTDATIAPNGSVSRFVKAGTVGLSDTVLVKSGTRSKSTTISVIADDKTPNAVSFADKTLQPRSTWVESEWKTLSGFDGSTLARAVGNGHSDCGIRVKTAAGVLGAWVTSGVNVAVNVGDQVRLRLLTSAAYGTARACTFYAGGSGVETSDVWTLTTEPSPASGQTVYLGITSGAISLDDLRKHFGPFSGQAILGDYYRGGTYVPDISVNAGVPTSGSISLDDFYGSATTLYFVQAPQGHFETRNTSGGGSWTILRIWDIAAAGAIRLGYGAGMYSAVEVKWDHVPDTSSGFLATVSCQSGSFGTWGAANANKWCQAQYSGSGKADRYVAGTFTVSIRHPKAPGTVLSSRFWYQFDVYSGL